MGKFLKKSVKKLIIYIVILMLLLSNVCYGYSQEEVGDAIAGFAAHVAINYNSNIEYSQGSRSSNPIWQPNSYTWDSPKYYFDCSSFASGCYHYVTGKFDSAQATSTLGGFNSGDWEQGPVNSISDLKVGDLYYWDGGGTAGHALIYIGAGVDGATGDSCEVGGASGNIGFRDTASYLGSHSFYYVRLSAAGANSITDLNTEFTLGNVRSSSSNQGVDLSDFYFNGIPDGKYSLAYTSIWTLIIETLAQIADFLIGLLTYIIRIPFIGWTAIIDNLLNWTVNTVTDTGTPEEDMGVDSVEVEGADDEKRLTMDGLLYNDYDLTDINIFK